MATKTFQEVLKQDPCNRAQGARAEIDFVLEHAAICDVLLDHVARLRAGEDAAPAKGAAMRKKARARSAQRPPSSSKGTRK